jgi:GxxExxY protein
MEDDNAGDDNGSVMGPGRGRAAIRDPLTFAIIGAAQKVHRTLGPGFKESTYQHAMEVELRICELRFSLQPEYDVKYEGVLCGKYQPDIVVENRVVLELKAVSALADEHIAQALSYLRASGLPVALLINFGSKSLTWKRFQN